MSPPRLYDREKLVPLICERLATGEPLAVILRDLKIPSRTVYDWRDTDAEIAHQLQEARDDGEVMIAWNVRNLVRPKEGKEDTAVAVARDKLMSETDMKLLAKFNPKRWADRQQLEHTGPNGGPIQSISTTTTDPVEAARIYQQVMSGGE